MRSFSFIALAGINVIFLFYSITAMPLLTQVEKIPEKNPMSYDYFDQLSADKRDLEETYFLTVPERLAVFLQLPRTDRKYFDPDLDYDPLSSNTIAFHNSPIEAKQWGHVPKPAAAAPLQKATKPIVFDPQAISTVTNSLKKP